MAEHLSEGPGALIGIERSVSVAKAADAMDVDESTVRNLLRAGHLRGHRAGLGTKRGAVRIFVSSIQEYQMVNTIDPTAPVEKRGKPKRERSPEHKEALAGLAALGILIPASR